MPGETAPAAPFAMPAAPSAETLAAIGLDSPDPTGLVARTMRDLATYFAERGHRPSLEHRAVLRAFAETMGAMAVGSTPASIFLGAADPGLGKTETTIHFARALADSRDHAGVGMLICVPRKDEAVRLAAALPAGKVVIFTSDTAANDKAKGDPNTAQFLITTQQMVEARAHPRNAPEPRRFGSLSEFYYRGEPRAVRVWDEAWLPGKGVTLDKDDLSGLFKLLRKLSPKARDEAETLAATMQDLGDGDLVTIPDFTAYGDLVAAASGKSYGPAQRAAAEALAIMSGRTVRVQRSHAVGSVALTYQNTLPPDLGPLLVLDASIPVRTIYREMAGNRKRVVMLPEARKDYSPLTIHWWKRGGGKTSVRRHNTAVVDGVVETIRAKPDEEWLIVYHLPPGDWGEGPFVAGVRKRLAGKVRGRVEFLNWGRHTATNNYRDTPNVILAGTLFYPPAYYTALTHLARDQTVEAGLVSSDDVKGIERGESANVILQAACRGRARLADGAKCGAMDLYIIAAPASGIGEALQTVFPGSLPPLPWRDSTRSKSPHHQAAWRYIDKALREGHAWIPYGDVRKATKKGRLLDPANFRRLRNSNRWAAEIAARGLTEGTGPRGALGLRRKAATTN